MKRTSLALLLCLAGTNAFAAEVGQNGFTYQGRIFDSNNTPLNASVDLTFQIMSPNGCVLYAEKQPGISLHSSYGDGYFAVQVGSAVSATKRLALVDPGRAMTSIFINDAATWTSAWSGVSLKDDSGAACTYTPAIGDQRALRVKVYNPSTGGTTVLTPDLIISGPSMAASAETLQGIAPSSFLQTNGAKNLSQSTLETLTNNEDASSLHHHDSLYAKLSGSASITITPGSYLNLGSRATDPAGLQPTDAGKIWYDATDNTIDYWDGSAVRTLGAASVASFNGRTGGVTLTQADVQGALGLASGTNSGYLSSADWNAFNTAASGNFGSGTLNAGAIKLTAGAASGKILTSDASGNASWQDAPAGGAGSVTSVTAGTGLTGGTITGTGTLSLANSGVTAGSYSRPTLQIDATGRVTSAANGPAINLATETTGTLSGNVITGGTIGGTAAWNTTGAISTSSTVTTNALKVTGGSPSSGMLLTSDASGNATWQAAPNSSQWITNGTSVYYNGGNVGIGTTSPTGQAGFTPMLAIRGAYPAIVLDDATASKTFQIGVGSPAGLYIRDNTASAYRMTINDQGYVGIGTTSPAAKLEVDGVSVAPLTLKRSAGHANASLTVGLDNLYGADSTISFSGAASRPSDFAFNPNSGTTPAVLIKATGNVGIGTTSPTTKLDVNGTINATAMTINGIAVGTGGTQWSNGAAGIISYSGGNVGIGTAAPSFPLEVQKTQDASTYITVRNSNNSASAAAGFYATSSTGSGLVIVTTPSNYVDPAWANRGIVATDNAISGLTLSASGATADFRLETGGTSSERLRVTSTGNVGIGTTNPTHKLTVSDSTNPYILINGSNSNSLALYGGTTGIDYSVVHSAPGKDLTLGSNGSGGQIWLESNGNVGIGTTSPAATLDLRTVDAGVGTKTVLGIFGRTGASPSGTERTGGIVFSDGNNPSFTSGIGGIRPNSMGNYLGGLGFYVSASSSTAVSTLSGLNEAMRIDSAGNVGIGTTAPGQKLEVNGGNLQITSGSLYLNNNSGNAVSAIYNGAGSGATDIRFRQAGVDNVIITASGNVGIGTTAPNTGLMVEKDNGSGYAAWFRANSAAMGVGLGTAGSAGMVQALTSGGVQTSLALNPGGGNVGIGTTNPTFKLEVNGHIGTSGGLYIPTTFSGGTVNLCYFTNGVGQFYIVTCASSRKYKTDIADLDLPNEEERLFSLRPVSYKLKKTGEPDIGLIAEEVAEVMPELSAFNDEGKPESVKYDRLGVLLLKVAKKQKGEIEELKQQNAALRSYLCAKDPQAPICQ